MRNLREPVVLAWNLIVHLMRGDAGLSAYAYILDRTHSLDRVLQGVSANKLSQ